MWNEKTRGCEQWTRSVWSRWRTHTHTHTNLRVDWKNFLVENRRDEHFNAEQEVVEELACDQQSRHITRHRVSGAKQRTLDLLVPGRVVQHAVAVARSTRVGAMTAFKPTAGENVKCETHLNANAMVRPCQKEKNTTCAE